MAHFELAKSYSGPRGLNLGWLVFRWCFAPLSIEVDIYIKVLFLDNWTPSWRMGVGRVSPGWSLTSWGFRTGWCTGAHTSFNQQTTCSNCIPAARQPSFRIKYFIPTESQHQYVKKISWSFVNHYTSHFNETTTFWIYLEYQKKTNKINKDHSKAPPDTDVSAVHPLCCSRLVIYPQPRPSDHLCLEVKRVHWNKVRGRIGKRRPEHNQQLDIHNWQV